MRSYAIVPPMLLDSRQRRLKVHNRNRLYEDPMAEYKELQNVNIWTPGEKRVFRERFFQHPKNFSFIASALERKVMLVIMYPSSMKFAASVLTRNGTLEMSHPKLSYTL